MELKIGENIRKVRELKGYSQDYMAQELGVSQRTYSAIENENNKIDTERLESIAKVLEVSVLDLLIFDDKVLFNNTHCVGVGIYSTVNQGDNKRLELYESQMEEMRSEMKHMRSEIEFLRKLIQEQFGKK